MENVRPSCIGNSQRMYLTRLLLLPHQCLPRGLETSPPRVQRCGAAPVVDIATPFQICPSLCVYMYACSRLGLVNVPDLVEFVFVG